MAPLEALVLSRLSVFAERWTLDGAVYVCAAEDLSVEHVAALHDALVAPGLIAVAPNDHRRFVIAGDDRRRGQHQLIDSGEFDPVSRRHAQWCLGFVEREATDATLAVGEAWLHRLDPELDNLRAALEWTRQGDAELGVALVSALVPYWQYRGHLHEGRRVGELGDGRQRRRPTVAASCPCRAPGRAGALSTRPLAHPQALVGQATELYEAIGDRDAMVLGLLGLARIDLAVGDDPAVSREIDDALTLAGLVDDRPNGATFPTRAHQ